MCASEVASPSPNLPPAAQRLLRQAQTVMHAQGEAPSPCVSVCRMSERAPLCEGCWRTLDEIAMWSGFAAEQKKTVWAQLPQRIQRFFAQA